MPDGVYTHVASGWFHSLALKASCSNTEPDCDLDGTADACDVDDV